MSFAPGQTGGGSSGSPARSGGNILSAFGGWGSVIGGVLGAFGSARQNKENRREAERNRKWQEYMSNTAVTRRMRDMKNAGINPILAGRYDASSPPGSLAHNMQNVPEGAMAGANSAMQLKTQEKGLALVDAQISKTQAEAAYTDANTGLVKERTILTKHGAEVASFAADVIRTGRELIGNKSPAELARWIERQIEQAQGKLTEYIRSREGTARGVRQHFNELAEDLKQDIGDALGVDWLKDSLRNARGYNERWKKEYDRLRKQNYSHEAAKRGADGYARRN